MVYETAGDPMSGLKWTRKTTGKISRQLATIGIKVSKTTVGKILRKIGFSLKSNSKKISNGGKSVSVAQQQIRDRQFRYISRTRKQFSKCHLPVESVDTKKKELIGNFKNAGTRLRKIADLTNDHDYLTYALGKAALYGVYDQARNEAFISVGMFLRDGTTITSADTPEFAVESIERWWRGAGKRSYPRASKILILADAGGSNSYRAAMWKVNIQNILCNKHGLTVTVCHYPPGASKWNPIEHLLFSEITKNWKGTPLIDYETVLKYTQTTKTEAGLKVRALLVKKQYEKAIKATDDEVNALNIRFHKVNSHWNYTISPAL